uniref:Uncharacterized protein n=1 Tax=Ditylenchus dipsaci TaxID=166011 RepID=A0A915CXP6_9BILA
MIISLAFVPPTAIWSCFAQLQLHLPVELAPILNWFKRNYVGKRLVLRHKTLQLAVMILGTAEQAPRFPKLLIGDSMTLSVWTTQQLPPSSGSQANTTIS